MGDSEIKSVFVDLTKNKKTVSDFRQQNAECEPVHSTVFLIFSHFLDGQTDHATGMMPQRSYLKKIQNFDFTNRSCHKNLSNNF